MAKSANARPKPPRVKTPAEQAVARIGWVLALIAVIGLIVKPATPWIFLWAFMLMFGVAKAPQDIRDAWRRHRLHRWEARKQDDH